MTTVQWESGTWTTEPAAASVDEHGRLRVTAAEGSDAWLRTGYGFVHDNAHGLLAHWRPEHAVEVTFVADFDQQFDQAGILVRADAERWTKTGLEFADGVLQLGAVVTDGRSDWSTGAVPEWAGREVTVRASRYRDALVIRARAAGEPWRLVRLAHLDPTIEVAAGPFCCAPSRAGLTVTFLSWELTERDTDLH
jgi:uncharacterized protein